jgi:hypothetical protein
MFSAKFLPRPIAVNHHFNQLGIFPRPGLCS